MTDIDNKHRSASWESVAREMQSERDAVRSEVLRLTQEVWLRDAEIERLRAEVERLRAGGCARDQKTTRWCAEAEALKHEIARAHDDARFMLSRNADLAERLDQTGECLTNVTVEYHEALDEVWR